MGSDRPPTRGNERPPSRGGGTLTRGGHKVLYDERVDWDWKTHNQDWHIPKSAAEAKAMPIAGVKQDRKFMTTNKVERPKTAMSGSSDINDKMRIQQQASYGHQFSFAHNHSEGSVLDGASKLAKTSQSYGLGVGPETLDMVQEGAAWEQSKRSRLLGQQLQQRPHTVGSNVYETANNNRNKWPCNVSQIGEIIFQHEYEEGKPGIPIKRPSASRGSNRSSNARSGEYSAHPSYAPEANRYDPHFTTTKAAVDHEAVGLALEEDLYRTANPQGIGFRVYGKDHDDTTVSADSPAWFQLPGVTVNKLSAVQLGNLVQWGAPVPVAHTEPQMINNFFGEEVEPSPIEAELHKKHSLTYDAHSRRAPLGGANHENYTEHPHEYTTRPPSRSSSHYRSSGERAHGHEQPPTIGENDEPGNWSLPLRPPSQASSVLSAANLEAHNRHMAAERERAPARRNPASVSLARESHAPSRHLHSSQSQRMRGSEMSYRPSVGAREGPRGDYPLPPKSAAYSQMSMSSRRTASIYGQLPPATNPKYRPASPALSASDLAQALKRAAAGDVDGSLARSGYTASVAASGTFRRPATSHSGSTDARMEIAHRLREASSATRTVSARN